MSEKGTKVLKSVRAQPEVFDRIAAIAKETGDTGAALEAMLDAYDLAVAKGANPDRAADIADFQAHCDGLLSAFMRSLELAAGAEQRCRTELRAQIEARDRTIAAMGAELEKAQEVAKMAKMDAVTWKNKAETLEKRVAELEKSERLAQLLESMAAQLDTAPPPSRKARRGKKADAEAAAEAEA